MPQEIERKFHIHSNKLPPLENGKAIKQAFILTQDRNTVRIRLLGHLGFLTIKGPTVGISRLEYEYPIPSRDAENMLHNLCGDTLIEKVRYTVPFANHVWEIDVFEGKNEGLVIAEIELEDESSTFERPEWLAKEVSDDPRYFNVNLAKQPYPTWSKR